MYQNGERSLFTLEERIKIAQEYLLGNQSASQLCAKYGVGDRSTIYKWCSRYVSSQKYLPNSKKSSIFAGEIKTGIVMNDPERQQLERQIADLERRLQKEQMKNLALNTLIDVAEEQGIQIRKKSGAKQ